MRPYALFSCALALLSGSAARAQSEKAFQADMLARLHKAMPTATFNPQKDDPFAIDVANGSGAFNEGTINLHRLFGYCQIAASADCKTAKEEFVTQLVTPAPAPKKEDLRVIVRNTEYRYYNLEKLAKKPENIPLMRQIGDDLFEILALDTPETIELASPEDLKKFALSADEAWAMAEAQTANILPPVPNPADVIKGSVSLEGANYLASALVQKSAWESLAKSIGPDMFVTVVSDDYVFVGIAANGPKLDAHAKAAAEDCKSAQRCVSPHIYRWRDGMWKIAR